MLPVTKFKTAAIEYLIHSVHLFRQEYTWYFQINLKL